MSFNFKAPRKLKKFVPKGNDNILDIHSKYLEYFEKLYSTLPAKQKELAALEKGCTDHNPESDISCKINTLKSQIINIKNRKEEYEYTLATIRVIQAYIDIDSETQGTQDTSFNSGLGVVISSDPVKKDLIKEYYEIIGKTYIEPRTNIKRSSKIKRFKNTKCRGCDNGPLEVNKSGSNYTCMSCGLVGEKCLDNANLSFAEMQSYDFKPACHYKRENYFNEWLTQLQASENSNIDQSVIDSIIIELNKERITDLSTLQVSKIRSILKKLRLSKYYERTNYIIYKITGVRPISIPSNVELKFKEMFKAIQQPFNNVCGKDRHNFLGIPYIFYKFSQLLELYDYLPYVELLKSREKLYKQDKLWEKIIDELHSENPVLWRYIPTI